MLVLRLSLLTVDYPLIDLSIKKEPPPEKKVSQKPPKNKQYGGTGSFVPSGVPSSTRIASASVLNNRSRQSSDVIPSSLRTSSSLAGLDLYVPPYERSRRPQMDTLTREFNEFGVSEHHYSASFPVSLSFNFICLSD
jgi:neural Wiskott-Aldrich syndrome protein